jgi:hypothetical protein
MTTDATDAPSAPLGPVAARAGSYYRNARYLITALLILGGLWFGYDGFKKYPAENAEFAAKPENQDSSGKFIGKPLHSDLDIAIQKVLCVALPLIGVGFLAFVLHKSRGAYQLNGDVVSLPGHPPFRLSEVTGLDRRLWERKGIAKVDYTTADGRTGRATLDDFIYDRKPTDQIYDAILAELQRRGEA